MARVVASVLVLTLLSPALAAIGCDVACALAGRGQANAMNMMTCHEHLAKRHGPAVMATDNGPCHAVVDAPAALLLDAQQWLATAVARPAAFTTAGDVVATRTCTPVARPPGSGPSPLAFQLRV